jgi:hypothetical protein
MGGALKGNLLSCTRCVGARQVPPQRFPEGQGYSNNSPQTYLEGDTVKTSDLLILGLHNDAILTPTLYSVQMMGL